MQMVHKTVATSSWLPDLPSSQPRRAPPSGEVVRLTVPVIGHGALLSAGAHPPHPSSEPASTRPKILLVATFLQTPLRQDMARERPAVRQGAFSITKRQRSEV
jgi:hypothetical protein